jgi:hypothetical protein
LKQEINFRSTTAYRSDDSADAHVEATLSVTYPTVTAQGNTVGWEQVGYDPFKFNISLSVDVRLAGSRGNGIAGAPGIYRVNLPAAGTYRIRCAAGRLDAIRGVNIRIFDDSSLLSEIIPPQAISVVGNHIDASNVERTAANWPSLNQSVDLTFTSSTLRVYNGGQPISGQSYAYIAHFSVESIPTSGLSPAFLRNYYMNQGWA